MGLRVASFFDCSLLFRCLRSSSFVIYLPACLHLVKADFLNNVLFDWLSWFKLVYWDMISTMTDSYCLY